MTSTTVVFKDNGNRCFQAGDYVSAEAFYSKAIISDPRNPILYTNRAVARIKMGLWDSVVDDCKTCLDLAPENLKAHFCLAQAFLALHNYSDALRHAQRAHELCVRFNEYRSLTKITEQVLECKKQRWYDAERRRRREDSDLEDEVVAMMERERDEALRDLLDDADKREVETEWEHKLERIRAVFQKSCAAHEKRRKVPDWALDDISFNIMVDPVVTKTGKSFERASIVEHLRTHPIDPLTREPLAITDLRPNLALKAACNEFLEENGWAADW